MNENIKTLVDSVGTDSSGKWVSAEKLETFAEDVILECVKQIDIANSQHCAYTTHDLGTVNCAKEKIQSHIIAHFNVKKPIGVF